MGSKRCTICFAVTSRPLCLVHRGSGRDAEWRRLIELRGNSICEAALAAHETDLDFALLAAEVGLSRELAEDAYFFGVRSPRGLAEVASGAPTAWVGAFDSVGLAA